MNATMLLLLHVLDGHRMVSAFPAASASPFTVTIPAPLQNHQHTWVAKSPPMIQLLELLRRLACPDTRSSKTTCLGVKR